MKILNIAHRGLSEEYPENTMIAFKKAVDVGANGIEVDIHLTKDGVIVINHDETIGRTYDGDGFIYTLNYNEILKYKAKGKDKGEVTKEKMPTLDEFLDFFKDKNIFLDIELKNTIIKYKNFEEKVVKKIREYKMEHKVMLTSFSGVSLKKIRDLDKKIKTGLLYKYDLFDDIYYGKKIGVNYMMPYFMHCLKKSYVEYLKSGGFKVICYGINGEKAMKKLIEN